MLASEAIGVTCPGSVKAKGVWAGPRQHLRGSSLIPLPPPCGHKTKVFPGQWIQLTTISGLPRVASGRLQSHAVEHLTDSVFSL